MKKYYKQGSSIFELDFNKQRMTCVTENVFNKGVVISEGIGSFWYERCDDFVGGLKPAYQYYYDTDQINDVLSWKSLTRQDRLFDAVNFSNQNLLDSTNVNELFKFRSFITQIKEELDSNDSYWGKFDANIMRSW